MNNVLLQNVEPAVVVQRSLWKLHGQTVYAAMLAYDGSGVYACYGAVGEGLLQDGHGCLVFLWLTVCRTNHSTVYN